MEKGQVNYAAVVKSEKFKRLMSSKKRFIIPMTVFFLIFYFALPILTSYTHVLNNSFIGPISWAWVFAFAQFIMTWVLCMVYIKKAREFDKLVDEIKQDMEG